MESRGAAHVGQVASALPPGSACLHWAPVCSNGAQLMLHLVMPVCSAGRPYCLPLHTGSHGPTSFGPW